MRDREVLYRLVTVLEGATPPFNLKGRKAGALGNLEMVMLWREPPELS